ncbi:MAG: KilA-N domain-containing protein [Bacteroidota bacterium]
MSIKKFDYDGKPISFEFKDGSKMINATEMAKPFGKPVGNFLRLKETKEYIVLLESRYSDVNIGETPREVLRIVKGGNNKNIQGTWMDEKLALKFAAWLSPSFELWVYDRIQELLTTGKTEIPAHRPPSDIISALRLIVDKLEYQERDINELKEGLQEVKDYVGDLEAKITGHDENYYSVAGYCSLKNKPCTLKMAQEYGRQATALSYQKGFPTGTCHDERYGKVGTYHKEILAVIID